MTGILLRHFRPFHQTGVVPLGSDSRPPLRRPPSVAFAMAILAAIAPPVAKAQSKSQSPLYDQPLAITHKAVKSDLIEAEGSLICYVYHQFMIKRLDSGSPSGDVSVGIVPTGGNPRRAVCTTEFMPGEITIKGAAFSFTGAKGDFLMMFATDPNGAVPFKVYDRRTGSLRYADAIDAEEPDGLTFIADEGGTLHLRFRRGVNTTCSIPKDGQACWAKIGRDAHFARPVANMPAPIQSCTVAYRRLKVDLDDPSIIVYEVDLTVAPRGSANVLSRGGISCAPMP